MLLAEDATLCRHLASHGVSREVAVIGELMKITFKNWIVFLQQFKSFIIYHPLSTGWFLAGRILPSFFSRARITSIDIPIFT